MKTFLIIIGVFIALVIGFIVYMYQNISYQPPSMDKAKAVNMTQVKHSTRAINRKVKSDLSDKGTAEISQDEFKDIFLASVAEGDNSLAQAIKKATCTIKDNSIEMEGVIDVKQIQSVKMTAEAAKYYDMFTALLPKGSGEVYISLKAEPYVEDDELKLADDLILKIGDFEQTINPGDKIDDAKFYRDLKKILDFTSFNLDGDKIKIIK